MFSLHQPLREICRGCQSFVTGPVSRCGLSEMAERGVFWASKSAVSLFSSFIHTNKLQSDSVHSRKFEVWLLLLCRMCYSGPKFKPRWREHPRVHSIFLEIFSTDKDPRSALARCWCWLLGFKECHLQMQTRITWYAFTIHLTSMWTFTVQTLYIH
jgi:hypothetical protein